MRRTIELTNDFKLKALHWAAVHSFACVLDNNHQANALNISDIELLVASGHKAKLVCDVKGAFDQLKDFTTRHKGEWIVGYLTYDLKNDVEQLTSNHPNHIGFPALCMVVPEKMLAISNEGVVISGDNWIEEIEQFNLPPKEVSEPVSIKPRVSREDYLKTVEAIKQHIIQGDVYELNYCVEFYSSSSRINPLQVYADLLKKSPVPFGAFVKSNGCYLMCASPERFLKKTGNRMLSQPIKGTSKRGVNEAEDIALKQALLNSEKERAENLMIVDLVRNDLARSAKTGTVKVEELFGIYSFEQVHQMISTVSATLADGIHWVDALKYAFPMGSMTGAPKISAMHLIEQYERTARGLYSGAVGYITPEGDFDFNVVIRSLQYNSINQFLNFEVGGAITYDSIPEKEYEECLIKAGAILDTLSSLSN
jgi:para-aminobenzoate synthetase component 1